MKQTVGLRGQFLSYVYICRAIFHDVVMNGTRLSFFSTHVHSTV
ncbi:RAxF-45 family protein [Bacillus coahuilensis]|nr:RAxF-45 family protein [Bacillus coahuilensis]